MSIKDWIAAIQDNKLFVIGICVFALAVIVFAMRSLRKYPLASGVAVMGCALILAGGFLIYHFIEMTIMVRAAHNWPTTTGVILVSKTETYYQTVQDSSDPTKTTKTKTSSTTVTYRYEVAPPQHSKKSAAEESDDGKRTVPYTSSTVHLSNRPNTSRYTKDYPVGKKVTVYYDPNNPSRSIIELESTGSFLEPFLGIVFIPMGLAMIYFLIRRKSAEAMLPALAAKLKNPRS